ncbi:Transcriptional regulator, GntR family [Marinobacterium lacunae]|uniref:Transcriptional regulator, GntR family n=1 Tax=Marinobacterium lacunae TaxID=1232683 RepID=A0A081FT02_9GAMM|nr:GntR family transcriptional regulator [Marinobacterium lacunae]KEA61657.1 Transcriptional regulator, GntR family [Marinobacterium lacunae]MBR9884687.1 GntR family transcriptional regulator [Oceanospirillales bacterium]
MTTSARKPPLAAVAYERIIEAIRSGALQPGGRVVETDLANWLGISRTPVREALRRLESEGLICSTPHQGMTIAALDYQAVIELYQMREVLEASAASLAAKHASEPELYTLREIVNQERNQADDPEARARLNEAFHQTLYRAAHNRYLLKALSGFRDSLTLLGRTTYAIEGRSNSALEEHEELLSAIEARDSDMAEEAARRHIRSAQKARIRMMTDLI